MSWALIKNSVSAIVFQGGKGCVPFPLSRSVGVLVDHLQCVGERHIQGRFLAVPSSQMFLGLRQFEEKSRVVARRLIDSMCIWSEQATPPLPPSNGRDSRKGESSLSPGVVNAGCCEVLGQRDGCCPFLTSAYAEDWVLNHAET